MNINISNVDIILSDKNIRKIMPGFEHFFDSWALSLQIPALRNLGKRTALDFINSLDDQHIEKLSEYFKNKITINKIDNRIIVNFISTPDKLIDDLQLHEGFIDISLHKGKDKLYISLLY